MRYYFRLVFPFIESNDVDYVTFSLSGETLDAAVQSGDEDLPWAPDTILEVRNEPGESAHIVMGFDRQWRFVDVAYVID